MVNLNINYTTTPSKYTVTASNSGEEYEHDVSAATSSGIVHVNGISTGLTKAQMDGLEGRSAYNGFTPRNLVKGASMADNLLHLLVAKNLHSSPWPAVDDAIKAIQDFAKLSPSNENPSYQGVLNNAVNSAKSAEDAINAENLITNDAMKNALGIEAKSATAAASDITVESLIKDHGLSSNQASIFLQQLKDAQLIDSKGGMMAGLADKIKTDSARDAFINKNDKSLNIAALAASFKLCVSVLGDKTVEKCITSDVVKVPADATPALLAKAMVGKLGVDEGALVQGLTFINGKTISRTEIFRGSFSIDEGEKKLTVESNEKNINVKITFGGKSVELDIEYFKNFKKYLTEEYLGVDPIDSKIFMNWLRIAFIVDGGKAATVANEKAEAAEEKSEEVKIESTRTNSAGKAGDKLKETLPTFELKEKIVLSNVATLGESLTDDSYSTGLINAESENILLTVKGGKLDISNQIAKQALFALVSTAKGKTDTSKDIVTLTPNTAGGKPLVLKFSGKVTMVEATEAIKQKDTPGNSNDNAPKKAEIKDKGVETKTVDKNPLESDVDSGVTKALKKPKKKVVIR